MSRRLFRTKGARTERSIHALQADGVAAVRMPVSGAVGGRFDGGSATPCFGKKNGAPR
jgi:Holliday junction resolvase